MTHSLRIATWNIAGAHKLNSTEEFDYGTEDLGYFVDQLKQIQADVVCLQESHTSDTRSLANLIARELQMPFVHNEIVSDSHIDPAYRLSNAVIAKLPLRHVASVTYPYPPFGYTFVSGKSAQRHDKMIQTFAYDGLMIANTHILPLRIFGKTYDAGEGRVFAHDLEQTLRATLRAPLIFCGDLNFNTPQTIYPELFASLNLYEALPDEITESSGRKTDHMLVSSPLQVAHSEIITTQTDHYLGFADITYER